MKTLIILVISVLSLEVALSGESEQAIPKKWEYKIWRQPDDVSIESQQGKIEKQLNAFGLEGWELVTVMWKKHADRTSPNGRAIYYFKRAIAPRKQAKQDGAPESKSVTEKRPKPGSETRSQ